MKFIRFLMTIVLVSLLSTAFVGCGGSSDGGGGTTPIVNDDGGSNDNDNNDVNDDSTVLDDDGTMEDEGTENNPIVVSLDTNYTFNISADDDADSVYLKVTTSSAGYYYFKATSEVQADSMSGIRVMLYTDQFEGWADATGYFGSLLVDLEANTTYYVEVQNTTSDTASCNVNIADIGTLNEGSISDPVAIALEETYSAKVGISDEDTQDSFYSFTTNDNSYYLITTTDKDIGVTLYRDSGFSDSIDTADDGKLGVALDMNTTYFIKVTNPDTSVVFHDLKVSGMDTLNEGTVNEPVTLTVDSAHNGKVGTSELLLESSYYLFTTDYAAKYKIALSNASLYMYLYSDPSFDESYRINFSDSGSLEWNLNQNTTYYLRIKNPGDSIETFDVSVLSIDEGTQDYPVNLPLETVHSGKIGSDSDFGTYQNFYQFTTNNEGYYEITASESTLDIYVLNGDTWNTYFISSNMGVISTYLDANTTYHLWVENNLNSDIAFDLKITEQGKTNEGVAGASTNLTLDATHNAKVGMNDGSGSEYSYYSFSAVDNKVYVISLLNKSSASRLDIDFYNDNNFSTYLGGSDDIDRTTLSFDTNMTYYMRILNYTGSDNVTFDLTIMEPDTMTTISVDENSSASPVSLATDTQYKAHVGTTSSSGSSSYYSLTTGSDTSKSILIAFKNETPSADLDLYLYSDSNYSTSLGMVDTSPVTLSNYDANTTYYFKIVNYTNTNDVTYDLLMQVDP